MAQALGPFQRETYVGDGGIQVAKQRVAAGTQRQQLSISVE